MVIDQWLDPQFIWLLSFLDYFVDSRYFLAKTKNSVSLTLECLESMAVSEVKSYVPQTESRPVLGASTIFASRSSGENMHLVVLFILFYSSALKVRPCTAFFVWCLSLITSVDFSIVCFAINLTCKKINNNYFFP